MHNRMALVLIAAFVAVGCGATPAASPDNTTPDDTEGTEAPDQPSEDGAGGLAAFFGWNDDPEQAEAEFREQEAEVQELVRRCMAEEGFDYQPVLAPETRFDAWTPEDQEENVRTMGFGITTWFGNEDVYEEPGTEWVDPNAEAFENMSESEQQAWNEALYGTEEEQQQGVETEVDPETGEEFSTMVGYGAGCTGQAQAEVYGDPAETEDLWAELQPAMEQLYQQVLADPRIVEANQEWTACMAEAGYEYESRDKMHEKIWEEFQPRLDEIVGPNGGYVDPFEGWTEDEIEAFFEEKTQEEIDAFFETAENQQREDIDQEALAALQQEEIAVAVADWECAEGFDDLYTEVSQDLEEAFIAEHRATLEQIREIEGG